MPTGGRELAKGGGLRRLTLGVVLVPDSLPPVAHTPSESRQEDQQITAAGQCPLPLSSPLSSCCHHCAPVPCAPGEGSHSSTSQPPEPRPRFWSLGQSWGGVGDPTELQFIFSPAAPAFHTEHYTYFTACQSLFTDTKQGKQLKQLEHLFSPQGEARLWPSTGSHTCHCTGRRWQRGQRRHAHVWADADVRTFPRPALLGRGHSGLAVGPGCAQRVGQSAPAQDPG